jgi:hypothetical protein
MGFGNTGGSYGYGMGMDDLLRKGMQSGKSSGGLGRKLFNVLGGGEGDPSQHSGMSILERGRSQAQNQGGLGKRVISGAIKSYLGGALGEVGELGTLSDAGGVMDAVKGGRSGLQDFITDKTGIPIGGQAIMGKGLELAGVNPTTVGHAQTIMGGVRDPQRKYGNVNQAMDPSEYLQPASVPTNASRQIGRQAGVRDLVSQRFGEGSPMTQYIGSYDTPGTHVAEKDGPITANVKKGEVIQFGGDPEVFPSVHPDLPGAHRRPTSKGGEWTPYADDYGSRHGDVVVPNPRPATGLQKALGYLSFVTGKFQGKPSKEFGDIENWNFGQDASEAIMNARLQRGYEGKAGRTDYPGYVVEQDALDAMRARIGATESGVMKQIGTERLQPTGRVDDETGRISVQQQIYGVGPEGGVGWRPVEGGYEGPQQGSGSRASRKVYQDTQGNTSDDAGTATHYRMEHWNAAAGAFDEPSGPPIPIGLSHTAALRAQTNIDHNARTLSIARTYLTRMGLQDASGNWTANLDAAKELVNDPNNSAYNREIKQLEREITLHKRLKDVNGEPPSAEDQAIMSALRRVYNAVKKQQGPDPDAPDVTPGKID